MSVIEFKPPAVRHKIERKITTYGGCAHNHLLTDYHERTVECADCKKQLEPFTALLIVAESHWRQEYALERDLEYQEKHVKKVQKAAVANLHAHGVTPEMYAERWAQREAEVKAEVALIAEKKHNQPVDIHGGKKGA